MSCGPHLRQLCDSIQGVNDVGGRVQHLGWWWPDKGKAKLGVRERLCPTCQHVKQQTIQVCRHSPCSGSHLLAQAQCLVLEHLVLSNLLAGCMRAVFKKHTRSTTHTCRMRAATGESMRLSRSLRMLMGRRRISWAAVCQSAEASIVVST
jgi:hypothetical protein